MILEAVPKAFKPIRTLLRLFSRHGDEARQKLNEKLDAMNHSIGDIKEINENQEERFTRVEETLNKMQSQITLNERDRLKRIIFQYGNYARKGEPITGEEFRYLQEVFQKYSETLSGNGIAKAEYDYVFAHYNEHFSKDIG